jgi:probable F420-dependent oxidoreductase
MSAVSPPRLLIDSGMSSHFDRVGAQASRIERLGYDGCWSAEINHDPFLPLMLAAEHTSRVELGTSIAVAFARNPMTVANVGWDLQAYSGGRFVLGLGSQIRPHVEKRFSMPWSRPVARMREFVLALQTIWSSWHDGTRLAFEGEFYTHKLMTPMFRPEPQSHVMPKIFLAAVGQAMTEMCGEVADGLIGHAFTTQRYVDEVTIPALIRGIERSGRDRADFELMFPVFVVTGEREEDLSSAAVATREQIAFYGSTPAYRKVLELHGWGRLQEELRRLSLQGNWDTMGTLIDDQILNTFAVVAPLDELAGALKNRFAGAIDRVMVGFPEFVSDEGVAAVLEELRTTSPLPEARQPAPARSSNVS